MIGLSLLGNAIFLIWVIFFGGARVIEGSWIASFEFPAMASEGPIKFLAWVWLLLLAGCAIKYAL